MGNVPDSGWEFILTNLKAQIQYHYRLITEAEGNSEELRLSINTLNGFLKEYTKERYRQNAFLKSITDEIRHQVLEAEDIVETYIYSVLLQKAGIRSLHKLGKGIEKLNQMVKDDKLISVPAAQGAAIVDNMYVGPPKKKVVIYMHNITLLSRSWYLYFFIDPAQTEIYTISKPKNEHSKF